MVETALIVVALVSLLLGMVDLSVGIFHQHVLSQAARQGVRKAIVHGATPGNLMGAWGPTTYGPMPANDSDPKAQAIAPFLVGLNPSQVNVTYTWPDASNAVEKRVQVSLSTNWTPVLGFVFGSSPITLTASSEMPIAH
jgi:hypothetical protein